MIWQNRFNNLGNGISPSFEQDVADGDITVTDLTAGTEVAADSLAVSSETAATALTTPSEPASAASTDNFPNFRGTGGTGIASKRNIPVSWDGKAGYQYSVENCHSVTRS